MSKQHGFVVDNRSSIPYTRVQLKHPQIVTQRTNYSADYCQKGKHGMVSRLDRIKDWPALAKAACYSVIALARQCEVSPRQLDRFFHAHRGLSPHIWLHELRMRRAVELLCDQTPVKDVWIELGYKEAAHFTHDFKKHFGVPPSKFMSSLPELPVQSKNVRF